MKNSKVFWNNKNQKIEIWHEDVNGKADYWKKVGGISYSITKREYNTLIQRIKEIR